MVELVEAFNLLSPDGDVVKDQVVDQPVGHAPQNLWLFQDTWGSDGYVLRTVEIILSTLCKITDKYYLK